MKTSVRAAVEAMFQPRASMSHNGSTVDKSRHFYEKVIKVKADVAGLLIFF
jgi:hypothetical protein